jgi:regulatory protein
LRYRSRSQAEVRTKLSASGYADSVTEQTIRKLRELNYLNDDAFAESWAQYRVKNKGYGPRRIEQELRAKGIEPSLTREAIHALFERGSEKEYAAKLLQRKFRKEQLSDPKTLRRAIAFLQRRGYSSAVIFELLGHAGGQD